MQLLVYIHNIAKPMSAVFTTSYNRKTSITLCGVVVGHILLIWALSLLQTDQFVETHTPENAINIRFIRMNKTETIQESRNQTQTHASHSQVQSTAQQQPMAKTAVTHQQQSKVIQSRESKTTTLDQPQQHVQKKALAQAEVQSSQSHTEMTQQQTASGQSDALNAKSGGKEGRENKQEQSAESAPKQQQPIVVSQVDILSFGKLNYDDRELQNQQRLLILTIKINPKGQPVDVQVKQGTGLSHLDARGVQAAQKAKFKPHILNGEAVAMVVDFPIQLKLGRNR